MHAILETQMSFHEPDYVTVHSVMNIMTANNAKMAQKFPQYCFQAIIIKHLMEKRYYKHTMKNVAVWLSCYIYIFAIVSYLTTVNQCLTIFFFSKNYVQLERSSLYEAKESIKLKVEM